MMRVCLAAVAAFGITALPVRATAADSAATPAASAFDPAALEAQRTRLKSRLRTAAAAFELTLGQEDERAQADWYAYLQWDNWGKPLVAQAGAGELAALVPEMKRAAWRLYIPKDGFENPQIVALRTALADYITLQEAIAEAEGDLAGETAHRIERLTRAAAAEPHDFAELESAAWWLAITGQGAPELARVRAVHDQPVIVVQIHRELIENKLDTFERTAEEQRPTRQYIGGARVVGTADVESRTTAALLEGAPDARLRVTTRGTVVSPHNVSTSGRVRVASSSHSDFTVTAEIYWDGERIVASAPQATAELRSQIKSISAPRLVRRAAERRVQASRGSAQSEAESLIEEQAAAAMREHLATAVEKLNRKTANFLAFLTRTGNKAERWTTSLRPTAIQLGYTPASYAGLGARRQTIPALAGEETLGLSFHDAALEGVFRAQLAGKAWTDVNFAILQRELTGGNTHEHMVGLEPERWTAQWHWRRPVAIHFTPEYATVAYRFARVEIDGYESKIPFEVSARMKVHAPPLGLEMEMLAPASVASLDPERPLPPQVQSFLERKFRGLFTERFSLDGLQFPAGGVLDPLSAYRVVGATLDHNWAHLRYTNRKPTATPVKHQPPTDAAP